MRKTYCRPTVVSERCHETSAPSRAKTEAGGTVHLGEGSTSFSGHSAGSQSYSHTPGTSGPWLHVNPGWSSVTTAICYLAYFSS
jgi:hypothetical protein